MAQYKLKYFPGQSGRAEPIRLAFAVNGIEFENDVVTVERFFKTEKAAAPQGMLPTLEFNGAVHSQSGALARYIGRVGSKNLYPEDPYDALKVDEIFDHAEDIFVVALVAAFPTAYGFPNFPDDEAKRVHRENVASEILAPKFAKLDAVIAANDNGGLIVANHLTIAELRVIKFLREDFDHFPTNFFEAYPHVLEMFHYVGNVPEVKAWYEKQE